MTTFNKEFFTGRHPRVMAHRGASGEAPENTIPAFDKAVEQDADILEMDVHMTSDGHVVVCHDLTVDRTTNGTGAIAAMTLAELQQLDAGYRFTSDGATFPFRGAGVRIPTLEEVLDRYPNVPVNIDIKANGAEVVERTCQILRARKRFEQKTVLLASFSHAAMKVIRRVAPDALTSLSVKETRQFMLRCWLLLPRFRSSGRAFQVPVWKVLLPIVTRRFVKLAHRFGVEVHTWTIDNEKQMRRLLDIGVDGLFTNFPARARKVIAEKEKADWRDK
jgi:glycerophosphoryl diester phosphodiesterase